MNIYQLHSKEIIKTDIETAWLFLSNPKNLNLITPPKMSFEIISGADRAMYSGQIINYSVKPLPFYLTNWVTEITHIKEGRYFVDEQRFGPYKFWHHKHFIKQVGDMVEMEDLIHYGLPMGVFGRIAHPILVKKQLNEIFTYRSKKLQEIFK